MPKGGPNKRYTGDFKQMVVNAIQANGLGYHEAARQFDVARSRITSWERIYLEEGAEGLYAERRGQASAAKGCKPRAFIRA